MTACPGFTGQDQGSGDRSGRQSSLVQGEGLPSQQGMVDLFYLSPVHGKPFTIGLFNVYNIAALQLFMQKLLMLLDRCLPWSITTR
jgi:hypothetical protein